MQLPVPSVYIQQVTCGPTVLRLTRIDKFVNQSQNSDSAQVQISPDDFRLSIIPEKKIHDQHITWIDWYNSKLEI